MIEPSHFWIGICKTVDLELSTLLDAAAPRWKVAEEQIAADLSELKEAMMAVGISPVKLRRALRAELGPKQEAAERPLHRSMALRNVFKSGTAIAKDKGESLRPAHLIVALTEQLMPELEAAMEKLELDSTKVMQELRDKISRPKRQEKRKKGQQPVAEEDEKPGKKSALERFGRDLTALAAEGALSPLIGRRAELIRMTQVLLQNRKNNLILIGEPGVGKTVGRGGLAAP
ncbi:MAG: hypothetical protein WEB53_13245 [Akkermansiaceae bacterium]